MDRVTKLRINIDEGERTVVMATGDYWFSVWAGTHMPQ
jgi:hypothetical protein